MLSISCPKCDYKMKAPDELAGKKAKCGKCGHKFIVEAPPLTDAEFQPLDLPAAPAKAASKGKPSPARTVTRPEVPARPGRRLRTALIAGFVAAAAILVLGLFLLMRFLPQRTAVVGQESARPEPAKLSEEDVLKSAPESSMTAEEFFEYKAASVQNTGDGRPFTEHTGKRVKWRCVIDEAAVSQAGELLVTGHSTRAEQLKPADYERRRKEDELGEGSRAARALVRETEARHAQMDLDLLRQQRQALVEKSISDPTTDRTREILATENQIDQARQKREAPTLEELQAAKRDVAYMNERIKTRILFYIADKSGWARLQEALETAKRSKRGRKPLSRGF